MSQPNRDEWFSERLARVASEFATAGFRLHPLDGAKVIVSRWGMQRVLADLDEAEEMLRAIRGNAEGCE